MSYWYLVDELNHHFVDNGLTITLFYTDRGQCIIGYEIKELSKLWKKNMTVDQVIHILADAKTTFERETQKYADNFKTVTLEHTDDEPEIVHFPVPYMIEFV
jgi:dephospho-CoA kinase